MKTLIVGAAGFVGGYLARCLMERDGFSAAATRLPGERFDVPGVPVYDLDILDPDAVGKVVRAVSPEAVVHLAAQSSVALSWKAPDLTVDVNIKGALHVLDAVRALPYQARVLLIGSGEEYGRIRPEELPVTEESPLRPGNLYAATKAAQNMFGRIYGEAYGMDIVMVRAFNHIGPGQSPMFVAADFCKQVAEIEAGLRAPVLRVGNLSARRDFTDVRDVVEAYALLLAKGRACETYNVASGEPLAIEELLSMILRQAKAPVRVETDPDRLRPSDVPVVQTDISKLTRETGWIRHYALEQTIADTLEYWRAATHKEIGR